MPFRSGKRSSGKRIMKKSDRTNTARIRALTVADHARKRKLRGVPTVGAPPPPVVPTNFALNLYREDSGSYMSTPSSGPEIIVNPGQEGSGRLFQYHLETSNVNAVEEMVNMISTQRAYEMNSKVIQSVDQMMQAVTNLK